MKQAYFNRAQQDCNIPEFSYDRSQFISAYGTAQDFENFNNNTDWMDEVIKHGFTHDHNLSVSGGGDKAKFRASFGYYNQDGTIIGPGNDPFLQPYEFGLQRKFADDVFSGFFHHLYG